ncbi:hypothetical protein Hanom_Chr12g01096111 [Helianthus anomalus]
MHTKKCFFSYKNTLQCRAVTKTRRFDPVNQTKTDGCLTSLLTGPKSRTLAAFWSCQLDPGQSFVWLTGPKRSLSSAFWSGQQTRQTPVSLCLIDRNKTSRFEHSSTLQSVHIKQKSLFWVGYLHTNTKCIDSLSLNI